MYVHIKWTYSVNIHYMTACLLHGYYIPYVQLSAPRRREEGPAGPEKRSACVWSYIISPLTYFIFHFTTNTQDLYRQIVSHTSEVRACIRTAEENAAAAAAAASASAATATATESSGNIGKVAPAIVTGSETPTTTTSSSTTSQPPQSASPVPVHQITTTRHADNVSPPRKTTSDPNTNNSCGGGGGGLKGLETRYHMLYLRAIEVQCLLEGLLARKEKEEEEEEESVSVVVLESLSSDGVIGSSRYLHGRGRGFPNGWHRRSSESSNLGQHVSQWRTGEPNPALVAQ